MKRILKRAMAVALTAIMLLTAAPLSGFAGLDLPNWADLFTLKADAAAYSGKCGANLTWSLDTDTGVLTISGTGDMYNWDYSDDVPWYSNRSSIKTVVIGDSVTSIGECAFAGCIGLTSVTIGNSVTSIGRWAFGHCESLTSVTIPDSVTSIGSTAFYGTGVYNNSSNWENNVLYIGNHLISAKTSITGDYIIKSGTKTIACEAFYNCYRLTSVTIGNSVTSIGSSAFSSCDSLTSVTIPDSVTSIGDYAFWGCTGLTSVTIGNSVTSIDDWAFSDCTGLTSVTIPDSVTSIGGFAFNNCNNIYLLVYKNSFAEQYAIDNSLNYRIISKIPDDTETLSGKVTNSFLWSIDKMTETLTLDCNGTMVSFENDVAPWIQYEEYIKHIVINDGCTNISKNAFMLCSKVESVLIPNSVTNINSYAFYCCSRLTGINIPVGVTSIGDSAFYRCTGLTSVTIGNSVTSIGDYAFYNCTGLKELTIPCSAKIYNSENTFYNCTNIEKVTLTKGTGKMQNYGTSTSSSSSTTYYQYTPWYISRNSIKQVLIEDGVQNIGSYAFYDCTGLTSITIPDSVTSIGNSAFKDCTRLTSVTIPDSVTSIGEDAFEYCTGLTSVTIPDSVKSIGYWAFWGCTGLTSVTIPDSVTSIGDYAFGECTGLTSITIPDSVTSIGGSAFNNCNNIYLLVYKNSFAEQYAIDNSLNYRIISKIPDDTETLSGKVTNSFLWSIDKMTETLTLDCNGTMVSFENDVAPWIQYEEYIKHIVINDGCTNISKNAFMLCSKVESVLIPNRVTNINSYAFYGCSRLTGINIPVGVTSIGDYAFYGCTGLTSVTIPDSVTSIGNYAFYGCTGLTSVTIPDSVASIGEATFRNCTQLTSVAIPDSVTSIGGIAFCNCTGLTSVTIGNSVTSIGDYAFYNCTGLKELTIPCSAKIYNSENTFYNCTNIEKVTLTKGTGKMQDYGTSTSSSSSTTYYQYTPWYISRNSIKQVLIEDGVQNIGSYAFYGCIGLTKITIPDSVTSIGNSAFYGCTDLTSITIPDSVTSIGGSVFYGCTGLTSVTIPDSVTSIGDSAFYGCTGLTSISIPDSVTSFGSNVLSGCTKLTTLYIGSSKIYSSEFKNYTSLKNVTIGTGVTTIGDYAFNGCTGLEEMVIPYSVKSIGTAAFTGCTNLGSLTVYSRNCTFADDATAYYTTIYGFTGSTAETYANEKGFDFVTIDDTHTHVYDDANDKTCNLCGADRTVCEHPSTHIEHKDSTCNEHGYDKSICDICGATVSTTELPYKHDYVATVTDPTCTEQGYTTYTCSLCGDSYTADYTEPLNHPHKTWRVTKNPTATSTGLMTETCDLCGAKTGEMEIPMLIPNFVTGITVSPNRLALNVGETANLTAVITPDTAENKNVIWSSSDTDIATVADGVVTAKTPGVAMIIVQSEDGGYKDFCVVRVASLTPANGAVVDNENGLIYGISSNSADINSYVNTVDDTMTVECDSALLGTGSVVNIVKDDVIVDSYKIVLFGDVNGDSWYDGQDAITVSCLANGMLTREQVGEAVWMAADCNHDGVIDQLDVDLLNQAGVLLSSVDQTKTQEELLETSAEYNEYLGLIDQMGSEDTTETPTQDESDSFFTRIIAFIESIIKILNTFFTKII